MTGTPPSPCPEMIKCLEPGLETLKPHPKVRAVTGTEKLLQTLRVLHITPYDSVTVVLADNVQPLQSFCHSADSFISPGCKAGREVIQEM